jgi:hypothetical protein
LFLFCLICFVFRASKISWSRWTARENGNKTYILLHTTLKHFPQVYDKPLQLNACRDGWIREELLGKHLKGLIIALGREIKQIERTFIPERLADRETGLRLSFG